MAKVVTDSQHYTDIANAIREKTGGVDTFTPATMAEAIAGIETGMQYKNCIAENILGGKYGYDCLQLSASVPFEPKFFILSMAFDSNWAVSPNAEQNYILHAHGVPNGNFCTIYSSYGESYNTITQAEGYCTCTLGDDGNYLVVFTADSMRSGNQFSNGTYECHFFA